jgi:hypothetical protein
LEISLERSLSRLVATSSAQSYPLHLIDEKIINEALINSHVVIPAHPKGTFFGRMAGSSKIKNIDSGLRRNEELIRASLMIEFHRSRLMPLT